MAWESAERVQVNSAGQYRALINGQWVPVARAQKNSAGQYRIERGVEESEQRTGMIGAALRGAEQQISATRTALGSIFGSPEEAAAEAEKRQEDIAKRYEEGPSLARIKETYEREGLLPAAGQVISDIPEALAEQAPGIAASVASARAGVALGAMTGNPYAAAGLGFLGFVAPSVLEQIGSSVERQAEEGVDEISMGRAATAGAVGGAADAVAQAIPLGKQVLRKLLGPEIDKILSEGGKEAAEQLAKESVAKTVAAGAATAVVAEVPTEIGQQMLERWSAQLPLMSDDAIQEYLEVGYQAGLLAPLGAAGRYVDKRAAREEVAAAEEEAAPGAEPASVVEQPVTEPAPAEPAPQTPDELAEAALRELGPETESTQYRKKVEEITGLNPMQAGSLLARLTRKGVITAPDESGLRSIGEAAPTTTALEPTAMAPDIDALLGDVEVVVPTGEEEKAAEKFEATVEKIRKPEAAAPVETVTAPPTEAVTTPAPTTQVENVAPEVIDFARNKVLESKTTAAQYIQRTINKNLPDQPVTLQQASQIRQQLIDEGTILGNNKVREVETIAGPTITWDTIKPGQQVTLYRGEDAGNQQNGEWWTTDRSQAEKFGAVTEVTLPSELIGKYSVKGHGGPQEFVFPTLENRPPQLLEKIKLAEPAATETAVPATISKEKVDAQSDAGVTPKTKRGRRGKGDALSVSGGRPSTVDTTVGNAVTSRVGATTSVAKRSAAGKTTDDTSVEKAVANTPKERYESVLARLEGLENTARIKAPVAERIRRTLVTQGNPEIPDNDYEPILSQAEEMVSKAEDWASEIESGKAQVFARRLSANERLDLNESMLREQEAMAKLRAVNERRREEAVASVKELRGRFAQEDEPSYVPELRELVEMGNLKAATSMLARAPNQRRAPVRDQPKQFQPIYKAVADKIKSIDFSRIRVQTENMPDADLEYFRKLRDDDKDGEFDPRTNTMYLRSERLNANLVLHELVHAGTVQTIRQYELDPSKLTEDQRNGVERLNNLRTFVQKQKIDQTLTKEYPAAFESPYEFVAVAMTSPGFQHRLAQLEYTEGSKAKNAWTDFVQAVAKVFGIRIKKKNQFTALDEAGQAFSQILAAPTRTVEGVAPLASRKKAEAKPGPKKNLEEEIRKNLEASKVDKFSLTGLIKYRLTKEGANKFVKDYQNAQRDADVLQTEMDRSEVAIYDGPDMNTLGAALDRSAGRLRNNENVLVPYFQTLDKAVGAFAAKTGTSTEDALVKLGKFFTAETVDQRRLTNFIKEKPLRTKKELRIKGIAQPISYSQYRDMLIDSTLTNKALTDEQRDRLYQKLLDLTINDTDNKYADELGDSYGKLTKTGEIRKPGPRPLDIKDDYYNIISYLSDQDTKDILAEMADSMRTNSAEIKAVRQALLDINKLEQKFNEEAGFLSQPAKNLIKLYGWDKYVPLAGKMKKEAQEYEDRVYRNSMPNEIVPGFRGRENVGNNPILMTRINAGKSAARAANTDVTLSLTNLMKPHPRTGKQYVKGELVTTIPFKDQYTGEALTRLADEGISGKRDMFYQRLANGDLAIWRVDDPKIVDAVRPEFDPGSILRRGLQTATNFIGQNYTRYQPKFAPYDFPRNVSFNTGAFKAEFGSQAASNYIMDVGAAVFTQFRLPQMWKISRLHSVGDFDGIRKLGKYNAKTGQWKDPFIRNAFEYLERGGKVSVVQTWQAQRRLQRELEQIEKGPVRRYGEQIKEFVDGYFDTWIDMFDLVARVVAYNTAKSIAVNVRGMNEEGAQNFATNFAKNLANFEKRGAAKAAKRLSAAYAFFAPSATGAVRNLDALAPAFKDVEEMIKELSPEIRNDPQAVAAYRRNYEKLAENARGAMGIYFGVGMVSYFIALSMGTLAYSALAGDEEEEEKKNTVAEDDMELWTRNLRLPLNWIMEGEGKKERFLQIPWGFGMGSFAAAGAQVASVLTGNQDLPESMANMAIIGLDSYVPLPIARYNPWGNLGVWALDSVMPTAARGMFEYAVNLDGLGRQIYRDYHNRFGPAYVSGGGTQEAFRDLSKFLADFTNQAWTPEPSELKFIASTYFDGGAALVADIYDLGGLLAGRREFDPKQDLFVFDSFFGSKIDKNVADYQQVRQKVERFRQGYMNASYSPREGAINRFVAEYPNAGGIAWRYNQLLNDINQYNEGMAARMARAEDQKERQRLEDEARETRTLQMRRVIDMYDQNKKEIDKFNRLGQLNPF